MIDLPWIFSYLILGAGVGFFAGLLGIGGGGMMVPALVMIFIGQGMDSAYLVHMALGTSLASIVVTSLSSLYAHHQYGAVQWLVVQKMLWAIFAGAFVFALLSASFSASFLAIFFSVFMTYIAAQLFLNIKTKASRVLPGRLGLSLAGFIIGAVSALVAIGGGSLTVPFLTWCNMKIQHAIATSAALGLPIALAGGLGYMISGWHNEGLPAYSIGYVYLPAVILISVVSVFTVPLGAKLTYRLPVGLLKKLFAIILLMLAVKMLQVLW